MNGMDMEPMIPHAWVPFPTSNDDDAGRQEDLETLPAELPHQVSYLHYVFLHFYLIGYDVLW